jgi:hypothetical protein
MQDTSFGSESDTDNFQTQVKFSIQLNYAYLVFPFPPTEAFADVFFCFGESRESESEMKPITHYITANKYSFVQVDILIF